MTGLTSVLHDVRVTGKSKMAVVNRKWKLTNVQLSKLVN